MNARGLSLSCASYRSFTLPNGDRQIFIARVAAGRVQRCAPDRGIRHPHGGFDSVVGTLGGAGITHAVYLPYQSYPAYLMTYRESESMRR